MRNSFQLRKIRKARTFFPSFGTLAEWIYHLVDLLSGAFKDIQTDGLHHIPRFHLRSTWQLINDIYLRHGAMGSEVSRSSWLRAWLSFCCLVH